MVEKTPHSGCHQYLCSTGDSQLPPASLRGSLRSTNGSDPSSLQITASTLGLRACEILCATLRVQSLFPTALWVSQKQALLAPSVLAACLPSAGPPGWRAQYGAHTPRSLEEPLQL